jgi:sulfoacetaldehyde acetyltransferase
VKARRISGSESLVEALRLEGVDLMFGIVGSAFMDPLDIFPQGGIRFVQVRHEQTAAFMADGYGRASGKPGVCIGQNGPGVTNLVTGVASAYVNHTPVIVLTPTVTSQTLGTRSFQEIEQIDLFSKLMVYQARVNRPDRMGECVRSAFRAAVSLRGPAQVDIPRDYYYGEFDEVELRPEQYRTDGRFGGAPEKEIEKAAGILESARNPVILAGLGAVDANAGDLIAELAERYSAPVACVFGHNDAFFGNHPLYAGPIGYQGSLAAMRLLKEADVVLALGTRLNKFGIVPQYDLPYFPTEAKLIHNSINPLEIGATCPIAAGLVGDCGEVVGQLLKATEGGGSNVDHGPRRERIAAEKKKWTEELKEMSFKDADPIYPRRALWEVSRAIPDSATVVADVGNISGSANAYFSFDSHRQWIAAGSLGGIGVAYPTALGVKLAQPDRPVFAFMGDGAWGMTLQEVMTAVTEKINVIAILFDNGQYGAEKRNQYDFFGQRYFWTELDNPDFAQIARDMGAHAVRVEKAEQIGPAIQEALDKNVPSVINIVTSRDLSEPYRRDALLEPQRLLERYKV